MNIAFVPVAAGSRATRSAGARAHGSKGSLSRTGFGLDPGSFHPNLGGQRDGYGAAVNAALR